MSSTLDLSGHTFLKLVLFPASFLSSPVIPGTASHRKTNCTVGQTHNIDTTHLTLIIECFTQIQLLLSNPPPASSRRGTNNHQVQTRYRRQVKATTALHRPGGQKQQYTLATNIFPLLLLFKPQCG